MTLKEYLNQKPIEECFDLIPSVYRGRDLHKYKNAKIKLIKTDPKDLNRKIILLEDDPYEEVSKEGKGA